jgi:dTDP-D-glucose 4,6-dehydratase
VGKLLASGWKPCIALKDGIQDAYDWFLKNKLTVKVCSSEQTIDVGRRLERSRSKRPSRHSDASGLG